jgi:hypothetical protein
MKAANQHTRSVIPANAGIQVRSEDRTPAGVYPECSRRAGVTTKEPIATWRAGILISQEEK